MVEAKHHGRGGGRNLSLNRVAKKKSQELVQTQRGVRQGGRKVAGLPSDEYMAHTVPLPYQCLLNAWAHSNANSLIIRGWSHRGLTSGDFPSNMGVPFLMSSLQPWKLPISHFSGHLKTKLCSIFPNDQELSFKTFKEACFVSKLKAISHSGG
jgi:hypothetical protein